MAYVRKVSGGWRVEVEKLGQRRSATWPLKATAVAWGSQQEAEILAGRAGQFPAKTVKDALDRYELEVSRNKRGRAGESKRFAAFLRDFPSLGSKLIRDVKTPDLVAWRDARLKVVSPGSVQRDINLLRNVWTVAREEWLWCGPSPWTALKKPGDNAPRQARVGWREIRRIVRWLGYRTGQPPETKYQQVAWAFMIGLRTALRAGEIMGLASDSVDHDGGVVTLGKHKTVERIGVRRVPLTPCGARLLRVVCTRDPVWTIGPRSLDALFRKARAACLIGDVHFHDSRAEALTSMSRRMDVLTLAKISGHRDLNVLMDSYYRETAEQISARLAGRPARRPAPSGASASTAGSRAPGSQGGSRSGR